MSNIKGHPGISSAVGGVALTEAQAEQAVFEARQASQALRRRIDAEIADAKIAIEKRFEHESREASAVLRSAQEALRLAKDATPDHPWTGRRVTRMVPAPGQASWLRNPRMIEVAGVVETVRSDTEFPANISRYSRPPVGSPIVRLLNKAGGTGLRFETMGGRHHGWKLAVADTTERQPQIPGGQP